MIRVVCRRWFVVTDPIVTALTKALQDTQRALESERARNEQLVARLHRAGKQEEKYQEIIREQLDLIELLEGHGLQEVSDVA